MRDKKQKGFNADGKYYAMWDYISYIDQLQGLLLEIKTNAKKHERSTNTL